MPSARPPFLPSTRREFLRRAGGAAGLLAFSRVAPSFLVNSTLAAVPAPARDRTILVVVQLAGGNDGLNTVLPFTDDRYYRLRPTLAIPASAALRLGDHTAFHPAAAPLHRLFHDGRLAIVQNVGYPNPNRSHFRSAEIWETASDSREVLATGWLGRYFDHACAGAPARGENVGIHFTAGLPPSFISAEEHPTFGFIANPRRGSVRATALLESLVAADHAPAPAAEFLEHTLLDALASEKQLGQVLAGYKSAAEYPSTDFATSLRHIAALIASNQPTRVYFTSLSGFDTHNRQADTHTRLLTTLAEGLAAFQRDLEAHRLADQVLTMTFSEFGRRPHENESRGTDHGTAAPLFVMGSRVRGGLHGHAPSLDLPPNADLTFSTDFRSVYATVLERWLACPSSDVLGEKFPLSPFLA